MSSSTTASTSLWENLSRHWTEADSTKQTLMAVFLIVQLVGLSWAVKGSLDKIFGRRPEYRGRRTKRFARRAAIAAAGGSSKSSIPLSHQRPLYRPDTKPQLPPRPTQDHPLLRPTPSAPLQTTVNGDIVLPSWTESGPTPLNVIVEDPEGEISRTNSPLYPSAHPSVSPDARMLQQSWSFRSASPRDTASLRLRERNDYAILPFSIDRSSTPDTRLEDVKRPFNRSFVSEERSPHYHSPTPFSESLPSLDFSQTPSLA